MRFLKNIRLIISIVFFLPILLYFIDFTGKLPLELHLLLKLQWIPALLSLNMLIIVSLLLFSIFFGRLYCSTICPLGVFQDIISWKSKFFKKTKKKLRFDYSAPQNLLRYSILGITLITFVAGSSILVIFLDPYSIFGRIVSQLFQPIAIFTNNIIHSLLNSSTNTSLNIVDQLSFVPVAFVITISFFILVVTMSWFRGRLFCNTICPVGTSLGLLSKLSLFHITINESSCTRCGACEKSCKSQCIDSEKMTIDDTRCVSCFNCLNVCKKGSMSYEFRYKKTKKSNAAVEIKNSRRTFLLTSGAIISSLAIAKANTIANKKDAILTRKPIMPPGASNIDHFNAHCTACQLCVTKCPMQILKPAALEYGISGIMQPHLNFDTNYCTYECNICSTVCPTSALKALTIENKKITQIGIAKLRLDMCEVIENETDCGACAANCPTQAIQMIPYINGLLKPEVTENLCIGCGGCESVCPVGPYKAIYVEGTSAHKFANKVPRIKVADKKIDDFGF